MHLVPADVPAAADGALEPSLLISTRKISCPHFPGWPFCSSGHEQNLVGENRASDRSTSDPGVHCDSDPGLIGSLKECPHLDTTGLYT